MLPNIDYFLFLLSKYDEKKGHNMLSLMLDLGFKSLKLIFSFIGHELKVAIIESMIIEILVSYVLEALSWFTFIILFKKFGYFWNGIKHKWTCKLTLLIKNCQYFENMKWMWKNQVFFGVVDKTSIMFQVPLTF